MAQLERDVADAWRAGKSAAVHGKQSKTNPFDAGSELASVRVQAKMWLRGFDSEIPDAFNGDEPDVEPSDDVA